MTQAWSPAVPARLERVFGAFDHAGLRWSLLRPRETLSQSEGDIDVLVEPDVLERARAIAAAQGFLMMDVPGSDVHAADFDTESGRFLWLHLQTEARLGAASVPAKTLLEAASGPPLPQPADDWLLWLLLLRGLLEKGGVAERHRPYVAAAARAVGGIPAPLGAIASAHGLEPATALRLAADEDWPALSRMSVTRRPEKPSWRRRMGRVRRRLADVRGPDGLTVAVIGPDGAGKTTLVEGLRTILPLPVRVQYMGLTGGRMPKADALRVPGLVLAARLAILWSRYARARWWSRQGGIVLFDRYTLDGAVPPGVKIGRAGRLSRGIQRRACPMPDLVLLLDASGATMHARKGEYDAATLESWRMAFGRLRSAVTALEVLDAERPAEAVRADAAARIWRRYRSRRAAAGHA